MFPYPYSQKSIQDGDFHELELCSSQCHQQVHRMIDAQIQEMSQCTQHTEDSPQDQHESECH